MRIHRLDIRRSLPRFAEPRRAGVALALLAIALAGCRSSPTSNAPNKPSGKSGPRILLLACDGIEWNVVLPLLKAGDMPNLEALMKRGVFGTLRTYAPAKSPVIWTTVATGKTPEKHGITNFFKSGTNGESIPFTSADRRTKALWNILSDAGRTCVTIGWWNTFPVEPVRGCLVAQTNTMEDFRVRGIVKNTLVRGVEGQVFPPERQNELLTLVDDVERELPDLLRRYFGDVVPVGSPMNVQSWNASAWAVRADEAYRRIASKLLDEIDDADLFTVYFGTTDVVGHRFWRFYEPRAFRHVPLPEAVRAMKDIIPNAYRHLDALIGELVRRVGDSTNIMVVSDHGMHAENVDSLFLPREDGQLIESGAHTDGPPGLVCLAGPAFRTSSVKKPIRELTRQDLPELGVVTDVAPTVLAILGLPIGRDMDGRVLGELLDPKFEERIDVQFVATHDTPEWLASRGASSPAVPGTKERIEQLRALGYLGDSQSPATTQPTASERGR